MQIEFVTLHSNNFQKPGLNFLNMSSYVIYFSYKNMDKTNFNVGTGLKFRF